jgi:hypothetical protein
MRVAADSQYLAVEGLKFFTSVTEGDDLSRAYEGPVFGVEEKVDPLAIVVVQSHIGNFIVNDCLATKVGGRLVNLHGWSRVLDDGHGVVVLILSIVVFVIVSVIVGRIIAPCSERDRERERESETEVTITCNECGVTVRYTNEVDTHHPYVIEKLMLRMS